MLQQTLLEHWLGGRDDLCVVGDDYQSIYAFTGAGPEHLLAMPGRYPGALVVRLEQNYRSTPEVLLLANRLVPELGGVEKVLDATRASGPEPVVRAFTSPRDEGAAIVEALRALDCPLEGAAILCRTNARLTDFEELLHEAGIPFQGASLLGRDAARRVLARLARIGEAPAREAVRSAALAVGWLEEPPDSLGERELVRQTDLARLVALADTFDGDAAAFVDELRRRFDPGGDGARGVHLLTLHRAKGLEFDAVFLPRLEAKELPSRQARTAGQIAEERRLLYVGLTRAKRVLWVTWSGTPSPFLRELGAQPRPVRSTPRESKTSVEWTPARRAAPRLAARARTRRRRAALRRLPRPRAARDRGHAAADDRGARRDRGCRTVEARALRRRGSGGGRGRAGAGAGVSNALELDHVVLAAVDLDAAGLELERRHALASVEGGRHSGFGTVNRIVPLGDAYLELVAVADEVAAASTAFGRWMTAGRAAPYAPLGWAVRTTHLDSHAARLGLSVEVGERRRPDGSVLRWRLAGVAEAAAEPCLPFFIEWAPGTALPGRSPAAGATVERLLLAGSAAKLSDWLARARLPVTVDAGAAALRRVALRRRDGGIVLLER